MLIQQLAQVPCAGMENTCRRTEMWQSTNLTAHHHSICIAVVLTIFFTMCLCKFHEIIILYVSPDFDGYWAQRMQHDMSFQDLFHDVFVYLSRLGRVHGTNSETLTPQDPQQVSKRKYEATAPQAHPSTGYPHYY